MWHGHGARPRGRVAHFGRCLMGGYLMRKALVLAAALAAGVSTSVMAQTVGVSWSNFQEERWKTDEAAIKAALEAAGATYISTDAQ